MGIRPKPPTFVLFYGPLVRSELDVHGNLNRLLGLEIHLPAILRRELYFGLFLDSLVSVELDPY